MIPMDYTVIPIFHMLIYQRFRTWKSFFWAEFFMALAFAYIAEPALVLMGIYKPILWKYTYSILPYIGIALLGKWTIGKIKSPAPQGDEPKNIR